MVALALAESAVPVNPPCPPAAAGPPVSVDSVQIRPPPVPNEVLRTVCPAGAVHAVVAEELSAQYDTIHAAALVVIRGVTCAAVDTVSATPASVATMDPVGAVPRYAVSRMSVLASAASVTLTVAGSFAPARRCHSVVVMPFGDCTC